MRSTAPPLPDRECVAFLQWALPELGYRWPGFRKVRNQVRKGLRRRLVELGLPDLDDYRRRLADDPEEWSALDDLCRITVTHYYRGRRFFERVGDWLLERAESVTDRPLSAWSAGCASGEEPYTLSLVWDFRVAIARPRAEFTILATDLGLVVLDRARRAVSPPGALRELPNEWREAAFEPVDRGLRLAARHRQRVRFECQDLRKTWPESAFDLVLCRNLVLTYFDAEEQKRVMAEVADRVLPGGLLGVGSHEEIPPSVVGFERLDGNEPLFRRL